eukprot:COSAG01_NODE_3982_length_5467_cov_3.487891_9_plen_62_part_00
MSSVPHVRPAAPLSPAPPTLPLRTVRRGPSPAGKKEAGEIRESMAAAEKELKSLRSAGAGA